MKFLLISILIFTLLLSGCTAEEAPAQIAATTLPVYEFTSRLCDGTGITVSRLVTENVSCLHDYSLNVRQVKAAEAAEVIVISGAGLEEFMEDILCNKAVIDASVGIDLLEISTVHEHEHEHGHDHDHEEDPHIWLSPANAKIMAINICAGLCEQYPAHSDVFEQNLSVLLADLDALEAYGQAQLSTLCHHDLITFHDGFGYFAEAFGLHILEAVEEESGSEASAQELKHLITVVREHDLPAIFIEINGSVSAADVISRETGATVYALDMAMSGDSYFDAMYHNIDTIKEALG
ncbi:MAG: metal ABC transporter substrate-binding protein [Oscillospiraceae bacterium]|nr:metal ABC transporter substrate-binding protein [Oscillospiraceae bacterium]